jgi:dTMP kinase
MFYQEKKISRGVFIVIDGTDGSGKKTQLDILAHRLKAEGFDIATADFPQYGKKSAGLVEEYLNGKYGTAEEVGPYRASIFYACDRYDASLQIKKWLQEKKIVITNRYVTANMGHQGGKINDPVKRTAYFNWLYDLEYEIFNIPKPDLNIILHIKAETAQRLVDEKGNRQYLNGVGRDIHEADLRHLENAERVYLEIARTLPNFTMIECAEHEKIMPKEKIGNLIWQETIGLIKPLLLEQRLIRHNIATPDFFRLYNDMDKNTGQNILKIERLSPTAKLPTRGHAYDAGLDLYADDYYTLMPGEKTMIKTGIKTAIPAGHVGLIWDKSGIAQTGIHSMAGVIDAEYRGEILVNLINLGQDLYNIAPGQKIAQMLIQKIELPVMIETKIDDQTSRNDNGFGSTGLF